MSHPTGTLVAMRRDLDDQLAAVAANQHGTFSRAQAVRAGATETIVQSRLETGAWVPAGSAAYRLRGTPGSWRAGLRAALFDAGPGALVSHAAAAQLHRFPGFGENAVEVLVPRALDHECTIADVHECRRFELVGRVTVGGLAVTAPEPTVVMLAAGLRLGRLAWLVDELVTAKMVDLARLHAAHRDLGGRGCAGSRVLTAVLVERLPGSPVPESRLERTFLSVVAQHGLPRPAPQRPLPGRASEPGRVDFTYAEARLVVEVDGRRWHSRVEDFERDRRRDLQALAGGYRTARVTWAMLRHEPDEVCRDLRQALRRTA